MRKWTRDMILSSINLRKASYQQVLGLKFLLLVAAVVLPASPALAENGLWNTSKLKLQAVANQDKEWDLRQKLADPMKLPRIESTTLPAGFSLINKKVNGADTVVLKGRANKVGDIPTFHIMAYDANSNASVIAIDLSVVAKAISPTAGQGGAPPAWTERPLNLTGARAGEAFAAQSISGYARDPDPGDTLTFTWQGGEKWLVVSTDGTVSSRDGKVPVNKAGSNGINVRVTDKAGNYDEVNVFVEIQGVNEAPRWELDGVALAEIKLRDAEVGKEMNQDVSIYAYDPDGVKAPDFFVFDKTQAPWFEIRTDGLVNGEPPANTPTGSFKVVLGVTDGTDTAYVIARGKVGPPNNSPTFNDPIKVAVRERSTFDRSLVGDPFVTDIDGDALEFEILKPALPAGVKDFDWITLSPEGRLVVKAPEAYAGKTFDIPFTVTDNRIALPLQGTLQISVLIDPLPPRWIKPFPSTLQALANVPFEHSLTGYVRDDKGLDVTFEVKVNSGPKWLLVDKGPQDPRLHGRPDEDDAGTETKATIVAKNSAGAASAGRTFTIKVGGGNKKPVWVLGGDGKVTLRKAKADEVYQRHLLTPAAPEKPVVGDTDTGDKVASFKFVQVDATNAWAYVNPQGLVFGDPSLIANARTAELDVTAYDTKGASETARIVIPLGGAASPPEWDLTQADPISSLFDLGSLTVAEGTKSFDLAQYVKDADDDPKDLKYTKKAGPSWLNLQGTTPQLVANPPAGTVARDYTAVFDVTDGSGDPVDAGFKIKITTGGGGGENVAPEFKGPVVVNGKAATAFSVDLRTDTYVKDESVATLTFGFATGGQLPEWISLSPEGLLEIRATSPVGEFERSIKITDNMGLASQPEVLRVVLTQGGGGGGNVRPPIWIKDSIADGPLVLRSGEQTIINLPGEEASNRPGSPAGLGLYFGKAADCTLGWVTVSRAGELRIAPLPTTTGSFSCDIIASNDPTFGTAGRPFDINRDSRGILRVTVTEPVSGQTFVAKLGEKITDRKAPIEILFVIDNESYNGIPVNEKYFEEFKVQGVRMMRNLDSWNVGYNIAMISARDLKGRFLAPSGVPIILKSSNSNREDEFRYRVDCTRSNSSTVSPLLSLGGFNDNVNSMFPTIINGKEFLQPDVGLIVVIVSHKPDQFVELYPQVIGGGSIPTAGSAARMLYKNMSVKRKKPMVVYVQDSTCLVTKTKTGAANDYYDALSGYNYGTTYTPNNCGGSYVTPILDKIAPEIAFNAYRFAKYFKRFDQINYSTSRLAVFIEHGTSSSVELKGNTGAADDQWVMGTDASGKPMLYINWWNIRVPFDPANDRLVIKY